jgi:flagellar biosynthesis/type III secretory pathway protein FliH
MITTTKYKRRTFADVEATAYAKGWSEGREQARKEFEEAYNLLSKHSNAMEMEASQLRTRLEQVSLRRLAWARIKGLFGAGHDRMA